MKIEKKSKMEIEVEEKLKELKIEFYYQYKFPDCVDIRELEWDFYIPSLNLLIEVDGEQHFKFIHRFHKVQQDFIDQVRRDRIKNKYADDKHFNLLRISHDARQYVGKYVETMIRDIQNNGANYKFPDIRAGKAVQKSQKSVELVICIMLSVPKS